MTAQQVAALGRADELPPAASLPEVDVQANADVELDQCSVHILGAGEDVAPMGRWQISYQFSPDHPVHFENICGAACAQTELRELLEWGVYRLGLHLPTDWAQTPATGDDPLFAGIQRCLRLVESLPNPAGDPRFEKTRNEIRAHLAQLGLNRIEQLAVAS